MVKQNYINSKHSTIGMTPHKVYKIEELVRISKLAGTFARGYMSNYTEKVFRVETVHSGKAKL